jgi:glycerophosphoryl diester phosphodiesterase
VTNPWRSRRIVNFAHQGGSFEGPSSTLHAIERALSNGASAIELDVHATKDRVLVVCHDETVDRTTNGSGQICDLTIDEIEQLDNAYWFIEGSDVAPGHEDEAYELRGRAPGDRRLGVVRLEEVLTTFPGVVVNMDIKRSTPDVEPYEELLASTLQRLSRVEDVIVASFLDSAIERFRALSPSTPTSAATNETANFYRSIQAGEEPLELDVVAFQVPETFAGLTLVDEAFVDAAHRQDIAVHVWTINERDAMERLVDLDVDGIISDCPSVLASVLGPKAWDGRL